MSFYRKLLFLNLKGALKIAEGTELPRGFLSCPVGVPAWRICPSKMLLQIAPIAVCGGLSPGLPFIRPQGSRGWSGQRCLTEGDPGGRLSPSDRGWWFWERSTMWAETRPFWNQPEAHEFWPWLTSPLAQTVKNLLAMRGTQVWSLGSGRSPRGRNGTPLPYSCQKNPWTEEPGGLQSMGSQRLRHDWATHTYTHTHTHTNSKGKCLYPSPLISRLLKPWFFFLPGPSATASDQGTLSPI